MLFTWSYLSDAFGGNGSIQNKSVINEMARFLLDKEFFEDNNDALNISGMVHTLLGL